MIQINDSTKSERELGHKQLSSNAYDLHKLFSTIFPSSSKYDDSYTGWRLKAFSRMVIADDEEINTNKFKEELRGRITTRAGFKRFMDLLEERGLIEKDEFKRIKVTQKAKELWESILNITHSRETKVSEPIEQFDAYFEHYIVKIKTDGARECNFLYNYCIRNVSRKPMKSTPFYAFSDAPNENFDIFGHSDNIEKYELNIENPNSAQVKFYFKKPLLPGEMIDIWFEFDWPYMFDNSWEVWDFAASTTTMPVKEFLGIFELEANHQLVKDSFQVEIAKAKDTKLVPFFRHFDPLLVESFGNKQIIWKMKNMSPNWQYKLSWKKKQ